MRTSLLPVLQMLQDELDCFFDAGESFFLRFASTDRLRKFEALNRVFTLLRPWHDGKAPTARTRTLVAVVVVELRHR